jgi:hypothetical protein
MILGAGVWAGIADATLHRLIFIGLATGFVMSLVFRRSGLKGPLYGVLAALLTVAACALGDAVGGTLIVAADVHVGAGTVLQHVPILTLMNVDALDGFFYALSAFVAFIRVLR